MLREAHQRGVLIAAFVLALALSGLARSQVQEWLLILLVMTLDVEVALWVNAALEDYLVCERSRSEREDLRALGRRSTRPDSGTPPPGAGEVFVGTGVDQSNHSGRFRPGVGHFSRRRRWWGRNLAVFRWWHRR